MIRLAPRLLAVALLMSCSIRLRAADPGEPATATPTAPSAPATPTTAPPKTNDELLVLPKIEVTASRIKQLDREIKRLDKAISREKQKLKTTELDKALNHEALAKGAAIFGGNSAEYMQQVAASRIRYMETERDLLVDMRQPQTLEDRELIEKTLEQVRTMRRELDNPSR